MRKKEKTTLVEINDLLKELIFLIPANEKEISDKISTIHNNIQFLIKNAK